MMILSSPVVDHKPSTKLSSPDNVTYAESNPIVISIGKKAAESGGGEVILYI
jgi:hypothetical protein